jgi:SPP1 gp7 family putative phage head morphogenesis protein
MTRAEFGLLLNRRAARLQPDVQQALLEAFEILRASLTDAQILAAIDAGGVERLLAQALRQSVIERAFLPVRQRIRQTVERSFKFTTADLPRGGKVNGTLAVAFDYLNPNVVTAVRSLESSAFGVLTEDTRTVVRQATEAALTEGVGPKTLARRIRDSVGLSPGHEQWIRNYEAELRGGNPAALERKLRDKRFDKTTRKLGADLSDEQITVRVESYRSRLERHNAETIARTTTLQSYKAGQELTWKQARESGAVPPDARLVKTWVTVGDDRVRPEHVKMNGQTVPIDSAYSNGQHVPGESEFNCRCISRITVEKAA